MNTTRKRNLQAKAAGGYVVLPEIGKNKIAEVYYRRVSENRPALWAVFTLIVQNFYTPTNRLMRLFSVHHITSSILPFFLVLVHLGWMLARSLMGQVLRIFVSTFHSRFQRCILIFPPPFFSKSENNIWQNT